MLGGLRQLVLHAVSLLKIFFVISLICFLPQLLFFVEQKRDAAWCADEASDFKLGIEQITPDLVQHMCQKNGAQVGLLTHLLPTTEQGAANLDLLHNKGIAITKLFIPSDQLSMHCSMMQEFMLCPQDDAWKQIKQEIQTNEGCFSSVALDDVDLLMIDLQDVGMSYHTYVQMVIAALKSAAQQQKPVVLLDRPNMLGNKVEGPVLHAGTTVGLPIRYGMTIGELAQFCNNYLLSTPAQLHVIAMQQYHRKSHIEVKDTPFAHCDGYSLCGLLEHVFPIDIGSGSDHAYTSILLPTSVKLPERCWYQLQVRLNQAGVTTARHRCYSKRKKQWCRGLSLKIEDIDKVDSFSVALMVLEFFKKNGVMLAFTDDFDVTVGTPKVREYLQGRISKPELCRLVNQELETFYRKAFGSFMYHPLPQVVLL